MKARKVYTDHRVLVNGLRLHYRDWGNAALPPLLLTHGAVANAAYWDLVAPAFRDRYHVIAVTARGRGKSDYAPDGRYGLEEYVQDFRELTAALGMEKLVYVGQSLGGKVGLAYAATYPDQLERLILVDIGAESSRDPAGDPIGQRPDVFHSLTDAEAWLRKFDRFKRLGDAAMQIVLQTGFHQLANEQWTSSMSPSILRPGKRAMPPSWDLLPRITCRTLLIHGTLSDVLSDEVAHRTCEAIADCRMVEMETGHLAHLEDPEEFIRVMAEFL